MSQNLATSSIASSRMTVESTSKHTASTSRQSAFIASAIIIYVLPATERLVYTRKQYRLKIQNVGTLRTGYVNVLYVSVNLYAEISLLFLFCINVLLISEHSEFIDKSSLYINIINVIFNAWKTFQANSLDGTIETVCYFNNHLFADRNNLDRLTSI